MDKTILKTHITKIEQEFYVSASNWRSSVLLSKYSSDDKLLRYDGLSCFWGLPKFIKSNGLPTTVIQHLLKPAIKGENLNKFYFSETSTKCYPENINHEAILEDAKSIFGNLFDMDFIESGYHKNFIFTGLDCYDDNVLVLLLSNIFSIFRYIDVDYLTSALSSHLINENYKIETVLDVIVLGEKILDGSTGHNLNDTITSLFRSFGPFLVINYLQNFRKLNRETLTDDGYVKNVRKLLKEKKYGFKIDSWVGQTFHYNILVDALKI